MSKHGDECETSSDRASLASGSDLGRWLVVVSVLMTVCTSLLFERDALAVEPPPSKPERRSTPLADAAERADWPQLRKLLKQYNDPLHRLEDASVDETQADGMTALHWASYHEEVDIVSRLLAAGASARSSTRYGITPLYLACQNGNGDAVRQLLKAGANPNAILRGGETTLMTAARTGKIEPVDALIAAGVAVDARDAKQQTALMWAAAEGQVDVVERLLEAGADRHARLDSGFTPFLFAVREGRLSVVRRFLEGGTDANEAIETKRGGGRMPVSGTSALLIAVENAHFELAVVLLEAGANPNDQRSGFTPLHALSWVRKPNRGDSDDGQPPPTGSGKLTSLQFARVLVERGADVNARLLKGDAGRGKLSMTGATPFLLAAKTDDLPYLKLLVELGADPQIPNVDGCTPLMAAAGIGTLAPSEEAGTEPEAVATIEYLLSLKADLNAVDRNGETAMHGAAYKSLPKVVELLADRGAKVSVWNRKNKYGWTPVLIAEGFRPGNFKPSPETLASLYGALRAAGVDPPPPTPRPAYEKKGYP